MALSPIERETKAMENDKRRLTAAAKRADYALKEQDIRDREASVYDRARERRLRSQNLAALADPGRYATKYYDQAKQWKDENRLQGHEIFMADKKGEWEVRKEIEHAKGLRGQGAEAAGINAEANKTIAQTNAKSALEIEQERQKGALSVANSNNASLLERSKIEQASHEKIAGINADAAKHGSDAQVDVQTEKNKGELAKTYAEQAKADQMHKNKMDEIEQRESLQQANTAEISLIQRMMRNPYYKGMNPNQILSIIRMGGPVGEQ